MLDALATAAFSDTLTNEHQCSSPVALIAFFSKLIEQGFGWAKSIGRMRQVMVRGIQRVDQMFVLTMSAYNLVRMRTLAQVRPQTAQ